MLVKYQKILFFIIILTMPITNFIKNFSYLGAMNGKLSTYFVIIALSLWIFDTVKNKKEILFPKYFKIWSAIFLIYFTLASINGLLNVHYEILVHEKLKIILEDSNISKYISIPVITKIFFGIKIIKNILFNFIFTFITSLWIYNLFYSNYKEGLKIFKYAVITIVAIFFIYSIPETLYLIHNNIGHKILSVINPFLYEIGKSYNWHPPLLWKNQMRLLFPEPSNIGLFISVILPITFIYFIKTNSKLKYLYLLVIVFYSYCIFMSQARTAYALLVVFLAMFFILVLIKRGILLKYIIALFCVVIGFGCYYFVSCIAASNSYRNISIQNTENSFIKLSQNYNFINNKINSNLLSIADSGARSNGARYGVTKTELQIGLDNVILGVGKELTPIYFEEYLSADDAKNTEIKLWLKLMEEKGIFKSFYPNLNEYSRTFAEVGLIGLLLFITPFFYAIYKINMKILRKNNSMDWFDLSIIFVGLSICLISWFGSPATAFYTPIIYLGFAFIVINKENYEQEIFKKC